MAALEPRHDTFEARGVRALPAVPVLVAHVHRRAAGAEQHGLLVLLPQLPPRRVDREAVLVGDRAEQPLEVLAAEPRPRRDRALGDAQVVVGDDELGVDLEAGPEPVAALARAVRRVEREVPRRQLLERQAAVRAGEVLGERERLAPGPRPPWATISTSATPSASRSAVSSESVSRRSIPARRTSRSTTTSIVCFS